MRILRVGMLAAICIAAAPAAAQAPLWPAGKPITIVVPFPPGPLDLVARLAGAKMSEALGQAVVVENRSGANGTIGASAVMRAPPDGHTLLAATVGTHVTAVHLMKSLPYDPLRDFTPIVAAVEPVTCLAVNTALPVETVAELIAYAKSRPDELSYGSSGVGSVFHMMGELFNQTAGVRIKHVPYRGVAPAMQDVVSGHIPMLFISAANAIPAAQTGRVKILAMLEETRYARLPQVPTMAETLPTFKKPSSWFGFLGPSGMSRDLTARVNTELVKALKAPDVVAKLDENGMTVIGDSPDAFAALMKDGVERYGAIIKAAGIQPE
ncbi:MAG: tripartite tricarboxylate transporter substrate binding protein [Hyphomicrobiales bacterium]|nr:tripartite tricarboxylate transporter substrate binding protein [Hyphomicrobiales bacterium]